MASAERTVLVLYGSETGNAQDMAEELGRICQRLHFKTDVEELDAVELSALLQHQLVIFVVSTMGQGDMPHNALLFWKKLLRKRLPPGCLSKLRYTCFGLGDSTYMKFNWAARKLTKRLDQLGASTFIDGYEADEQFDDGVEGCFTPWADGLKKHLLEHYPHPDGLEPIPEDSILPPRWPLDCAISRLDPTDEQASAQPILNGLTEPFTSNSPPETLLSIPDSWTATLVDNKRVTPEAHWQDVRLISFDIPTRPDATQQLHCNPGDCLTIYPKNFPRDVDKLITLMDWTSIADQPLNLSICTLPRALHPPPNCTLRSLLLHNIDFTAVPRQSFLKNMSYYATDPYHRERLLEFTQREYLDEYFDYATRSRRSILEVLEEFDSVRIPPSRILDVFPLIRGRDFSIANGGDHLRHPADPGVTRVELLVALVKYRTILRRPRQGLCSRYLAALPTPATLRVTHKAVLSPIHGAANAQRPLVATATGTGIAPVRSLIHERLTHYRGVAPPPMLLFFGNRNRAADFFFEDEWRRLAGTLDVFTAFSRDQREKIYVQDLLRREAPLLGELVPRRAIFSVCGGSSKMADSCKHAVFDTFAEGGSEGEVVERKKLLGAVTWWQEIW